LLIADVLLVNEIPNYIADRSVGKNTLVVRLGRKKAANVYAMLMAAAYAFIVLGVGSRLMPAYSLIALATLPMALKSIKVARKYCEEPPKMLSANILTILVHLITGLLLIISYVLNGFLSL